MGRVGVRISKELGVEKEGQPNTNIHVSIFSSTLKIVFLENGSSPFIQMSLSHRLRIQLAVIIHAFSHCVEISLFLNGFKDIRLNILQDSRYKLGKLW